MNWWKFFGFWLLAGMAGLSVQANDSAFHLHHLPQEGLVLNKGWLFHADDDPGYKFFSYSGKQGISMNPALVLGQLPLVKEKGFGWFRLKLQVDTAFRNKTVGLSHSLFRAAEI